jgi:hypothetical protein
MTVAVCGDGLTRRYRLAAAGTAAIIVRRRTGDG